MPLLLIRSPQLCSVSAAAPTSLRMFVWQPTNAALVRLYFSPCSTVAWSGCGGNGQNLGDRGADAPAFTLVSTRWAPRRLICHFPLPRSWKDLAVTRLIQYRTCRRAPPPSDNRQLYQPAQRRQSRLPASRCSQSKAFKLPCRGPKWRSRFSACHTDADAFGRINKHRGSLWGFFSLSDQTFIFEALTNTIFSNKTKSSEKIFTEFFNCCISSQKWH